jgi:hypothetical protein
MSLCSLIDHYRSFGHMSKEAPNFRYSKKRSRHSTQLYVKTKDLSSPKCHKVEKDTEVSIGFIVL